jgi:hypothetical protein
MTKSTTPVMQPSGNTFQDICTMIGLMTITWAWAETTLSSIIRIIIDEGGPLNGHPNAPLSLSKRVACFKDALRDVAVLKSLQQDGRALAMRFTELSKRRNDFIHGAAWETSEGRFESTRLDVVAGKYASKDHSFNIADALTLNIEISKLSDDAIAFMLKVCEVFSRKT